MGVRPAPALRRLTAALAVVLVLVVGACGEAGRETKGTTEPPGTGSSVARPAAVEELNTGPAPWPVPTNATRWIEAAGLPALTSERLEYHIHAHLDVFVDGAPQPVPPLLGIDRGPPARISPLHTHDASGTIHVESAERRDFTLGQLFTEWAVRLDERCAGGYCAPEKPVKLYVNGQQRPGDPSTAVFRDGEELALVIGTPPVRVPDRYPPPAGR